MARIPSPHRLVVKHPAPHATTTGAAPTQRFVGRCACVDASTLANSVFLKNETGDPSQSCISAAVGLVMPVCLWAWAASARRSGLTRLWWISSGFGAPSTRMGPPLTESPGRCRVHERGRTGSLKRQTQPCGAPRRRLKGWREQRFGIGCRLRARRPWRVSGTPNSGSWQGHRCMHCEEDLRAITSGAMANSGSRTRAWRAGNDCDAFCSIRSRARTALGNL